MSSASSSSMGTSSYPLHKRKASRIPGDASVFERIQAAACGSVLVCASTTPLDVLKIHMQSADAESQEKSRSMLRTLGRISRNSGGALSAMRTLYAPMWPALIQSVPQNVLYFTGYEFLCEKLRGYGLNDDTHRQRKGSHWDQIFVPMLAGGLARTGTIVCISPLEVVKTRMGAPTSSSVQRNGFRDSWSRGRLLAGLVPTILRDVPFSACYWLGYEYFRDRFFFVQKNIDDGNIGNYGTISQNLLAGFCSGVACSVLTHPFDVVKTRQQTESLQQRSATCRSAGGAFIKELRQVFQEGSAFNGLTPRLVRVGPACAVMITCYEYVTRMARERKRLEGDYS